jgi:hypothetical protein
MAICAETPQRLLNAIADDASTRMPTRAGHDVDAHIESGLLMGSPYGYLTGIVRLGPLDR